MNHVDDVLQDNEISIDTRSTVTPYFSQEPDQSAGHSATSWCWQLCTVGARERSVPVHQLYSFQGLSATRLFDSNEGRNPASRRLRMLELQQWFPAANCSVHNEVSALNVTGRLHAKCNRPGLGFRFLSVRGVQRVSATATKSQSGSRRGRPAERRARPMACLPVPTAVCLPVRQCREQLHLYPDRY